MIEPTETEPKERLDDFVDAMRAIAREAATSPELLKEAPHGRPVRGSTRSRREAADRRATRSTSIRRSSTRRASPRRLPELEAIPLGIDRPAEAADALQHLDLLVDLDAGSRSCASIASRSAP